MENDGEGVETCRREAGSQRVALATTDQLSIFGVEAVLAENKEHPFNEAGRRVKAALISYLMRYKGRGPHS